MKSKTKTVAKWTFYQAEHWNLATATESISTVLRGLKLGHPVLL